MNNLLKTVFFFLLVNFGLSITVNADQSLVERLTSSDGATRNVARKELKGLSPSEKKKLVAELRPIVRGQDESRALDSVVALGKLGPSASEALPDIFKLLATRPQESQVIFNSLVQIGTASIQGLIPLLECQEPGDEFPAMANEALERIGTPKAKAAMIEDPECPTGD